MKECEHQSISLDLDDLYFCDYCGDVVGNDKNGEILVSLTEDQADTLIHILENEFNDHLASDNYYAHFCHRIRMKVGKARNLAKAKTS